MATTISLVLTERLPESQLTVFEVIALGRQPYTNWIDSLTKKDLEKIHWAMEQTNLEALQNNRCSELSDGQMQRVLIARALSQDTEIIILDEPTAHLDMHQTIAIFELLKKLTSSTQKTIIISTHEINLATKMCDELIVLSENIIYTGTTAELIQQNAFENLFASKIVKFDRTLQQFVINSQSFKKQHKRFQTMFNKTFYLSKNFVVNIKVCIKKFFLFKFDGGVTFCYI